MAPIHVEIIAIGDELTSGRILNTTSAFAARHLYEAGFDILAINTIGDSPEIIGETLKRALSRADLILVSGGLGGTDDDLTNEAVSKALNRPPQADPEMLTGIKNRLEKIAWLPEGATALAPQTKIAGYQIIHGKTPIFFLPGIPSQMHYLLVEEVLPRLASWHNSQTLTTKQRLFKVFGLSESEINRCINGLELSPEAHIGYYPVFPDVHLSLTIRRQTMDAEQLFTTSSAAIREALGSYIYATDEATMEQIVGELLTAGRQNLAVAESCTGGMVSSRLVNVPGSSSYFPGGVVTYANDLKKRYLGISDELLATYGAVSKEAAVAMAAGIRESTAADIGLAITGIAGPTGGSSEKPVGTVYIGLVTQSQETAFPFSFSGTRSQIREITAQTALDLVRRHLLKNGDE